MSQEMVAVITYRGVEISYDPERKQFLARVGGREIRKPNQKAVESVILKYQGGTKPKRVMHIRDGWYGVEIQDVTAVGARGNKVLFRRPGRDEVDREDVDHVYVFDEKLFEEAQYMANEKQGWKKRWATLLNKMERVKLEDLK